MRVIKTMLVLAAVAMSARIAVADDVPAIVTQAHAAVQKNADKILKTAYPTAGGMTAATTGNYHERLTGGYALDEKFNYTDSDGDRQNFTLRFTLDSTGAFTGLSELNRSELWPTFATGNIVLGLIKDAARNDVEQARQNHREPPPLSLLILKADSIEDVVIVSLNFDR